MAQNHHDSCPDCDGVSRRGFIKTTVAGVAAASAASALPIITVPARAASSAAKASPPETLVASLYKSLSDEQKKGVCFPFDHKLRLEVDNNWFITKPRVGKDFNADQQAMINDIFRGLHDEAYAEKVIEQVGHDANAKGLAKCAIALFGEPGSGKFEFVLTGRHVTRRCDGDSVEGAAFGGPIFYGHAFKSFNEPADHPGNIYWYQALRANEVFKALDGKQRKLALLGSSREEDGPNTVKLTGKKSGLPGVPLTELSSDQKDLVRKVMADVLAPFRKQDRDESLKMVDDNGFDNLHMSFYKNHDIGNDGVWDVWQLEGPAMVWYFRGAPHVHTWVHIREKAEA